jgi:uncharacterized protein YjiS (DUF1127 family)
VTYVSLRHPQAVALYRLAAMLHAGARVMRAAAQRLDAWLEARRLAAGARAALADMSDRDLRDIGLARADVDRIMSGS